MEREENNGNENPRSEKEDSRRVKTANTLEVNSVFDMEKEYLDKLTKEKRVRRKLRTPFSIKKVEEPTPYNEGPLKYGDQIMVIARDLTFPEECPNCSGAALCGHIDNTQFNSFHLRDGSRVGCSTFIKPNYYNLYRIEGSNPNVNGTTLSYCQPFTLSPIECAAPSYLHLTSRPRAPLGRSGHRLVTYTTRKGINIVWKILPIHPIFDARPRPVMPNTQVVINHWASNLNLAAEDGFWFDRECEVTTFTYPARNEMSAAQNIWYLVRPNTELNKLQVESTPEVLRYLGLMVRPPKVE